MIMDREFLAMHKACLLLVILTPLAGCGAYASPNGVGFMGFGSGYGGGYSGTQYGSGGMEMGVHMGGWGDGYGGSWGHNSNAPAGPDQDPHYNANYQNRTFAQSYYHPAGTDRNP